MLTSSAETAYETARKNMLFGQLIPNRIHHSAMLDAMGAVPREKFLPERLQSRAYADEAVFIKNHVFLFAPRVLADLLLMADIQKTDFVLNVKSGTGYSAALMAHMAMAVVALESDSGLCDSAQQILIDEEIDNVAVLNQTPEEGFPSQAPFEVIFIDGIIADVPEALLSQLAEGGRLVCVTAKPSEEMGKATKVTKHNGILSYTSEFELDLRGVVRSPVYKNFIFEGVS